MSFGCYDILQTVIDMATVPIYDESRIPNLSLPAMPLADHIVSAATIELSSSQSMIWLNRFPVCRELILR